MLLLFIFNKFPYALQNDGFAFGLFYGYVLQPDSTLKHTEVAISNLNDGKNYIVIGGLKAGEQIVVEGVQNLQEGQKIVPITQAQREAKYQMHLKDQKEGNLATAF